MDYEKWRKEKCENCIFFENGLDSECLRTIFEIDRMSTYKPKGDDDNS